MNFRLRWWNTAPSQLSSPCCLRPCCTSASRLSGLWETLQVQHSTVCIWVVKPTRFLFFFFTFLNGNFTILIRLCGTSGQLAHESLEGECFPSRLFSGLPRRCLTGDGPVYRDVLIDCNVVPALLARISPDTPVRKCFQNSSNIKIPSSFWLCFDFLGRLPP